jgi:hypothetical protein
MDRGRLIAWILVVVIIGAFATVIYVAINAVADQNRPLTVGECLDFTGSDPTSTDMQRRPCTEAHDAEILLKIDVPGDDSAPLPTQQLLQTYVTSQCIPEFNTYTGRDFATDTELAIGFVAPTASGWADGFHTITCYINRMDNTKLIGSVRAGAVQ